MRRLDACYFGPGAKGEWARMATVLERSAREHCPEWERRIAKIQPAPLRSALDIPSHVANTQKMVEWARVVETATDGDEILLMDVDMVILRPLDDVWAQPFDYAYTVKPTTRYPFNSGVVFVRVSERIRAFFRVWCAENLRMLGDRDRHMPWRKKYGGINQAALGFALEHDVMRDLHVLPLPCAEWNCEDSSWPTFRPERVRILHVKSQLRKIIFNKEAVPPMLRPVVTCWRQAEARLREEALSA